MGTASLDTSSLPSSNQYGQFLLSKKFAINLFLGWTFIVSLPFVLHAIANGFGFLFMGIQEHRSFRTVPFSLTTYGIASHMMLMATMNVLAPVQLYFGFSGKNKPFHRKLGKVFLGCAFIGSASGWIYVLFNGSGYNGIDTNSSALYGIVIFYSAYRGLRAILNRQFNEHKEWAIRLFALGISSWLFRIIHANWAFLLGDFGANTMWKQAIISYGFYLIPLAGIEVYFRLKKAGMLGWAPRYAPLLLAIAGGLFLTNGSIPLLMNVINEGFINDG